MVLRVLLAEPDPVTRHSWRLLLASLADIALVGEAIAVSDVLRACPYLHPDVLVFSQRLLDSSQVELEIGSLVGGSPSTRILLSATEIDPSLLRAAVVGGISGCVLRWESPEAVALAVRTVASGASWFSYPLVHRLLGLTEKSEVPAPMPAAVPRFTKRERDVLRLLASGLSNKAIAHRLNVVERTVESHVTGILHKLTVASRLEAVIWAKDNGFPGPNDET